MNPTTKLKAQIRQAWSMTMYVWSVRLVVTSNEVILLTLLMQKLAILEQFVQWKKSRRDGRISQE